MPTDKRLKHLARQAAKQANVFTQEERQAEYDKFMGEFARLGISEDSFEEVKKFADLARDWVATGTAHNGVIPLVGLDRELAFTLNNSRKHPPGVMLKSTKPGAPDATQPTDSTVTSTSDTTQTVQQPKKQPAKIISGPRNARAAQRPRPFGGSV